MYKYPHSYPVHNHDIVQSVLDAQNVMVMSHLLYKLEYH